MSFSQLGRASVFIGVADRQSMIRSCRSRDRRSNQFRFSDAFHDLLTSFLGIALLFID
jgi:hypothetical protein